MNIIEAAKLIKKGKKLRRVGWDKETYICKSCIPNSIEQYFRQECYYLDSRVSLKMQKRSGLCQQFMEFGPDDLLADDWELFNG